MQEHEHEILDQPFNDVASAAGSDPAMVASAIHPSRGTRGARPAEQEFLNRAYRGEQRMKTWDECTPDERIERLRQLLGAQAREISNLHEQINLLMRHQHGAHGELLQPLYGYPQAAGGCVGSLGRYDPLA